MPTCRRRAARSSSAAIGKASSSNMPPGTKSVTPSFAPADDIQDVARALCAEPIERVSELRKGGNSRIFQVETRTSRYALKKYPATDNRNRLEAEGTALRR